MRPHSRLIGILLLLMTSAILVAPASAQSVAATSPRVLSPAAAEITKATLNETSIDGPALWTSTTGTVRGVLAWTQADGTRRLGVMTTAIGTKFSNKITLAETSFARPAVARTSGAKVAVAWAGTDASHTLNVLYDVYGARTKLTLWGDTSGYSPALVAVGNTLLLAWTGANSGRSLNVMSINTGTALSKGWKVTLASFSSMSGPSLSYESSRSEYVLGWLATSPANQLAVARSSDAKAWSARTVVSEWSNSAPALLGIVGNYYTMPPHYVAWTGMDSRRSLNFQYTRSFPSWPDPANTKVTLAEAAYQAPALGFISGPSLVLVAWTGTDAAHHLNVAVLTPVSPPPCALPGISPVTPRVISQGTSGRKEVALTIDAGGAAGRPNVLLDALKTEGVKSSWFITAEWAQAYPAVVARVKADGHLVYNHTVDHPDLVNPARSDNFICYQLGLANQILADRAGVAGTRPYFRPPYGSYNTQVVNRAAGLGYYTVMWSLNTHDDQDSTTADQIYNTVRAELAPGKIILMHAGSAHEPEAIARVLQYIKSQGYRLVTIDQLLAP